MLLLLLLLLVVAVLVVVGVLRDWIEKLMCDFCLAIRMNYSTNRLNISSIEIIRSKTIGSKNGKKNVKLNVMNRFA